MRTLLIVTLCGSLAAPAAGWGQDVGPARSAVPIPENPDPSQGAVLGEPAPPPAAVPQAGGETAVQEVEVDGKKRKKLVTKSKAGSTVGGLLGGLAGAAGGPVGKIVGGMVGKRIGKAVAGGSKKDETAGVESAEDAAVQANAVVPEAPSVDQEQVMATQPAEPAESVSSTLDAGPPPQPEPQGAAPAPAPAVRNSPSALTARIAALDTTGPLQAVNSTGL